MRIVNLAPQAMSLLEGICDPSALEDRIAVLDAAEEKLQELAAGGTDTVEGYNLYDIAYQLKGIRKEFNQLKELIEDGREEN